MKIVTYRHGQHIGYGIVSGAGVIDGGRRLGAAYPGLRSCLAGPGLEALRPFANEPADHPLDSVTLLPPIPDPAKIFCVGVNYATHLAESGHPTPKHPMIFTRFANSQVGAGEALVRPPESERFDFEGELAVVIGTGGRRIAKQNALRHVAGYSCYNDGSIRDWQRHTSQFVPGKNFAKTGGFGPWLVSADEVPDPSALTLVTRLNGQEMQRAPTSDLVFDIPTLITYCSTFCELEPGDVIVTGTTGGVGAYREPPVWMKGGDTVEVEISGIGMLRQSVVDEADAPVSKAA